MPAPAATRPCFKTVDSFEVLLATPFADGVNALCWQRSLPGDFAEIVAAIGPIEDITSLDEEDLLSLQLSPAGQLARETLLQDLRLLRQAGLDPNLDCIPTYPRDEEPGPVPTDVYSFHADSATVLADTYLCSYTVAASEGIPNEHAIPRVAIPETRAALLQQYGGPDDEGFRVYLRENCYDLHYSAAEGSLPYSFGLGNLWRIATQCPGSPVPPCIHRAPATLPHDPPRLLLIS